MKNYIVLAFILLLNNFVQAQGKQEATVVEEKQEDSTKKEDVIFVFTEIMPEFPGGEAALLRFLQKNIRYPFEAVTKNIQGTVMVEFVVEKDGAISQPRVVKGIGGGCNEESLRVVKLMPKWKPAKQNGKNVRVYFTVPIIYRLE